MKSLLTAGLVAVMALSAADAFAATGGKGAAKGERWENLLQRLDTDGDGAISLAEVRAAAEQRFARLDTAGNGVLSRAEFTALPEGKAVNPARAERYQAWREKAFERIAAGNPDGITREAYVAHAEKRFSRLDADGDGKVTREEAAAAKERMKQKRAAR